MLFRSVITTPRGVIEFKFYPKDAPNTVAAFIELAKNWYVREANWKLNEKGELFDMSDSPFTEKLVAVNRTAKTVKGGRQFGFTALTVVGDGSGRALDKSILDSVLEDSHSLQPKISRTDRVKLDEYLESIRDIETQLAKETQWLDVPKAKTGLAEPKDGVSGVNEIRLMYDLMVAALQTDSTRVVSLFLSTQDRPDIDGVKLGHHDASHHGQDPAKLEQLALIDPYQHLHVAGLRAALEEAVEQRLWGLDRIPWCRPGLELHLLESRLVAFDTGETVETPAALAELLHHVSSRSLFYHVHEAHRRTSPASDDFSDWLEGHEANPALVTRLRAIDFYFLNLGQLRREFLAAFRDHLAVTPQSVPVPR